ncbi:MAG TPA: hypothetical protein VM889_07460 [Candidatus Thermoplasmatota archaeon]|nr:hypothetical protein [Candidatus Thermoplasmatota archaeon]
MTLTRLGGYKKIIRADRLSGSFKGGLALGEITTIPLTKTTRDRLRKAGRKGETYDALVNRLLDLAERRRGAGVVAFERVE